MTKPQIVYTIPYGWRIAWLVVKGMAVFFLGLFILAALLSMAQFPIWW